jgi:hypothetical protein
MDLLIYPSIHKLFMFQLRFVFAIFCLTAILLGAIFLRDANSGVVYELCKYRAELGQLKQQLGAKQLRLETLITPGAVLQHLKDLNVEKKTDKKTGTKTTKKTVNKKDTKKNDKRN